MSAVHIAVSQLAALAPPQVRAEVVDRTRDLIAVPLKVSIVDGVDRPADGRMVVLNVSHERPRQ